MELLHSESATRQPTKFYRKCLILLLSTYWKSTRISSKNSGERGGGGGGGGGVTCAASQPLKKQQNPLQSAKSMDRKQPASFGATSHLSKTHTLILHETRSRQSGSVNCSEICSTLALSLRGRVHGVFTLC